MAVHTPPVSNEPHRKKNPRRTKGFSLIEVLVGIALVGIALLGLAQLFTYSVMNNLRSDRISNATFLAQQQIDVLRNLTTDEMTDLMQNGTVDLEGDGTGDIFTDEQINVNSDSIVDYRRITSILQDGLFWNVRVYVFPGDKAGEDVNTLVQNPERHKVLADITSRMK